MPLNVDLHSHSNQSDGILAPADVAQRAHTNKVDVWALTDHDELTGLDQARLAAHSLGIKFINGVEISALYCNRIIHIVALGFTANDPNLLSALELIRTKRHERAQLINNKLATLGVDNALQGALAHVDNPRLIGRVHFAKYLLELGLCKNFQHAFDKYLGENKAAFVPMESISLEQAVNLILTAGGKAVIAHPGRYKFSRQQFSALFDTFKDLGGQAIEVVTGSHSVAQYDKYARLALKYNFEASRGSDFHAPGIGKIDLGAMPNLPDYLKPVWHDLL